MALVLCTEIGIVRNNMTIVKYICLATNSLFKGATIVRACIKRVALITINSLLTKLLWKMFAAFAISHAFGMFISITTWTMNHGFCDDLIKCWLCYRIWNLS